MTRWKLGILGAMAGVLACGDDPVGTDVERKSGPMVSALQVMEAPAASLVGRPVTVRVRAVDGGGVAIEGLTLTVEVESGGGSVEPRAPVTDARGEASLTWTLGPTEGPQRISVRGDTVRTTVVVTARLPEEPSVLTQLLVASSPDTARVGDTVSVVLAALDQRGAGMAEVMLELEVGAGGGSLPQARVVTDGQGRAQVSWAMGSAPGPQTLLARADDLEVEVTVVAVLPDLGRFGRVTGSGQEAPVGWPLAEPVVAVLLDVDGRPVRGFPLSWTVISGGGTVEPSSEVTDARGQVSAVWTMGPEAGEQRLEIRASDDRGRTLTVLLTATAFTGVRIRTDLPGPRETRPYGVTLEAWGGLQGSSYRWSVAQGEVPPGLTLSAEGRLEGTPALRGSYHFVLRATDDEGLGGNRAYDVVVCEGFLALQVGEMEVRGYPTPCGPLLPAVGGEVYRVGLMARGTGDWYWTNPVPGGLVFRTTPELRAGAPDAAPPRAPRASKLRAGGTPIGEAVAPDAGLDPDRDLLQALGRRPPPRLGPPLSGLGAAAVSGSGDPPAERTFLVADAEQRVVEITATLRASSETILYYEDDGAVAGGGTHYPESRILDALESHDRFGHAVIMEAFGGYGPVGTTRAFHDGRGNVLELPVGDLDRNGRAIVLQLRPAYMMGAQGFASSCDLLPLPEHAEGGLPSCEKSNEAEIVYVRGPGSSLLAHELKHVSSMSWIIYGGGAPSSGWIEEGTAVVASELASRRASGVDPGRRVTAADLFVGGDRPSTDDPRYLMWAAVAGAYKYLAAAPYSAITGNPDPNPSGSSFYSSSWLFHRYVLDRYGAGDPDALMRRLNTESRGIEGLTAVTERTLPELFTELMEAVLVDDVPGAREATANRFRSYDFGDIMAGDRSSGEWPPFVGEADFGEEAWTLPTWETAANLFRLAAAGSEGLLLDVLSDGTGEPPLESNTALLILRVR